MPGSPAHLVRRFFDVLSASPLTSTEAAAVTHWVSEPLAGMFFEQSAADQRHGYHAALVVTRLGFDDPAVRTAALMHDVAKRHARFGPLARSIASVAILLRLPLTQRMAVYRDHGIHGAQELAAAGAPGLAIDFALHHHGSRPTSIPGDVWDALVTADQPPKASKRSRAPITSGPA